MRRLPKTHKKLPMKKKDEPDFYKLDQSNPLPQIHEAPIPGAAATVQAMRSSQNAGSGMHSPYNSSSIVTPPHLSPNQPGPNLINGGGQSGLMMGPGGSGGMNGMNGMGVGSMGMGGGFGNLGPPMPNGRGLNPRFGNYDSRDEYDLQQPLMGRDGGFGPAMGGPQPPMGGAFDRPSSSGYSNMQGGSSNNMRRGMRQGQGMDSMYGSNERHPPSPQNDFYRSSFDQHPMMSLPHQGLYGRGEPSPSVDEFGGSPPRRQNPV